MLKSGKAKPEQQKVSTPRGTAAGGAMPLKINASADKLYCVSIAPNESMVYEQAKQGGFPANRVSEIKSDHRSNDRGRLTATVEAPKNGARSSVVPTQLQTPRVAPR